MLIEQDWAHIISGVRHGATLGSPIGMTVENRDWANWEEAMSVRPPAYLETGGEPLSPRSQRWMPAGRGTSMGTRVRYRA